MGPGATFRLADVIRTCPGFPMASHPIHSSWDPMPQTHPSYGLTVDWPALVRAAQARHHHGQIVFSWGISALFLARLSRPTTFAQATPAVSWRAEQRDHLTWASQAHQVKFPFPPCLDAWGRCGGVELETGLRSQPITSQAPSLLCVFPVPSLHRSIPLMSNVQYAHPGHAKLSPCISPTGGTA